MNDTLDELLREHGRQWAQAQSAPPALEEVIANAVAPRARPPWLAVAAAVVAVAGVAAIPIARSVGHTGSPRQPAAAATSKPTAATESAAATSTPSPDRALRRLNDEAVSLAKGSGMADATGAAVRTTFADAAGVHPDWVRTPAPAGSTPVWVIEVRAGNDRAVGETLAADDYQTYAVVLARAPYDISTLGDVIELPMSS